MKYQNLKRLISRIAAVTMIISILVPVGEASAAQITNRTLTISSSSAAASNATTSYTFNVTVPTTTTAIKSVGIQICTTSSGTCTLPTGFLNSSSTLSSQPTNLGAATGWTVSTATAGTLKITNSSNATLPTGSQTIVFGNIQNPTTTNTTFYARMTTYSDAAYTTAIDTGTMAASTANQITVTAQVPESLSFCVYTGANCAAGGNTVGLGFLSSASASSGVSLMDVGTNASSGYTVTINGTTLTSGTNTIPAYSNAASSPGTSGFGINLRANTTPSVGADKTNGAAPAIGTYGANYGTANQFNFTTGDAVATSAGPTNNNTFTVSYVANIGTAQAAGAYTATYTYICTASF